MNSDGQLPPLARFVAARLAELNIRQADFCRQTGFDQGTMSKVLTGLSTSLTLESALRLAAGLKVAPIEILALVGRADLVELVEASARGVRFEEGERQMILLALFKLKRERPGWDYAVGEIEKKLGGQLDWPEDSAPYICLNCGAVDHLIGDCAKQNPATRT